MNDEHIDLLTSPGWHAYLARDVIPWVLSALAPTDLAEIVEIGPGPGLVTELLMTHSHHHVAVEIDPVLADSLHARLGDSVEVICADATRTNLPDAQFTAAFCLTMMHHVPSRELQDQLLGEAWRLLRPGGVIVGLDSLDSPALREFHIGDTWVPLDIERLPDRLAAAGFVAAVVEEWDPPSRPGPKVRFVARKSG